MAEGGMASDDAGVIGRVQAIHVYKTLGLYPKSKGEPSKGFKQNSMWDKFTCCKAHSGCAMERGGECWWQRISQLWS